MAERRARRKPGKRKQTTKRKHELESSLASTFLSATPGRSSRVPRGEEEELLHAVDIGDFPTVKQILTSNPYFNVNCTDLLGRTPMRLAVENEHLEIVQMLLEKTEPKPLYDALLLAITLDHDEIALTILRHPIYEKIERSGIYMHFDQMASSDKDESLFSAETTPLSLAAQRNRYEIVSLLVQKGQRIEEPHDQNCECPPCKQRTAVDELRFARSRLNAYKGLASEAYISLASDDPILVAFEMRRKLIRTATKEKHYREEYDELGKKLSDYVVKLLDNVRGNQELDVILNEEVVEENSSIFNQPCYTGSLARLKLAVKYDEKGFVAHPSCQKKLTTLWYGVFQTYRTKLPDHWRWLSYLILVIAMPFLTIAYWFAPHSKVLVLLRNPFVKFTGQTASFCVFLTLIITFSFMEKPTAELIETINETIADSISDDDTLFIASFLANHNQSFNFLALVIRDSIPDITQIIVCIFIVGLILQECKQLWSSGFKDHFSSLFNIIDFLSLALYVVSFTLRYFCFYKTSQSISFFREPGAIRALYDGNDKAKLAMYWLIADRYYWDSFDPMNVCEGFFAIANVLSFSRLFYLLAANEQLGPLQVSLRRMLVDLVKFFMIVGIIMAAFMVALNNLYWYYDASVRELVELKNHANDGTNAEQAFGTIELTFQTVYWALFGMGDSDVVELGDNYAHEFTERVGYIVYGAYNFASVTVLLNMLIAMMARSFDTIQNDESTEWKFARAQLYLDVMQDESFLPVPFNLIPSPLSIYKFFRDIYRGCQKGARKAKAGANTIQLTIQKGFKGDGQNSSLAADSDDDNGSHGAGAGAGGSGGGGRSCSPSGSTSPINVTTPEHRNNHAHRTDFVNPAYQGTLPNSDRNNKDLVNNIEMNVLTPPEKSGDQDKEINVQVRDPNEDGDNPSSRPFNKKSHRVKEYKQPEIEEPTYKDVIKRVVKRYIFESQKVEASPLEGDIEELKQDLSSFRYEVINALDQQRRALQESVNSVSAKLDIYSSGGRRSRTGEAHLSGAGRTENGAKVSRGRGSGRSTFLQGGGCSIEEVPEIEEHQSQAGQNGVEEEIVPQKWIYGGDTPGRAQGFTKPHRPRSGTNTSQVSEEFSEDTGSSYDCDDSADDSVSLSVYKAMNSSAYKCVECMHKVHEREFKDKPYSKEDLDHFIGLLNQMPVEVYEFDGGQVAEDGASTHDVIPVGYAQSLILLDSAPGSSEEQDSLAESIYSADEEDMSRSFSGPSTRAPDDSASEYSESDPDQSEAREHRDRFRGHRIVDPHLLYPPPSGERRRRSKDLHSSGSQRRSHSPGFAASGARGTASSVRVHSPRMSDRQRGYPRDGDPARRRGPAHHDPPVPQTAEHRPLRRTSLAMHYSPVLPRAEHSTPPHWSPRPSTRRAHGHRGSMREPAPPPPRQFRDTQPDVQPTSALALSDEITFVDSDV